MITQSPDGEPRDAVVFDEEPWNRHMSSTWRQVALLGSELQDSGTWRPPPKPAPPTSPTEPEQNSDDLGKWAAWWAPALHLLIYVLGYQEPIAALTRRLDGDRDDDHEAWALLESWWGADLRGFAAWGLGMELDKKVTDALRVTPVGSYGSLADTPREWARLAAEAGIAIDGGFDPLHLSYHAFAPLSSHPRAELTNEDDGRFVLIARDFRGWYLALLEIEEIADRPVEVQVTGWGSLGTFARPAPGQMPRLVPAYAVSRGQLIDSFSPYVQEHLGWYVYLLRDPRTNEIFHVGKGRGNLVFAHAQDTLALPDAEKPRLAQIRDIHEAGFQVKTELIRHHIPSERTANLLVAVALDTMAAVGQPLSDGVGGHHSDLYRRTSTEVAASIYKAPPFPDQEEPLVLLKIQQLWTPSMSDSALYEATCGWWALANKGFKARYAIAVSRGVTRGVFRIDHWRERVPVAGEYSPDMRPRLGFQGSPAPEMAHLVNRSIKHLPQPSRGPVIYINCDDPQAPDLPFY